MDKKDMREDRRLSVPYTNQSTVTECGEEFTLPDYYPEVRRVISTLCRVLPESWYDNGDTAEQGGVVAFTVMYLGDDGSLTAVPLTTDYTVSIQIPKTEENSSTVIAADTSAENVTCRATGPRRLTLRARLRTAVTGEQYVCAETAVTDASGGAVNAAEKISVQSLEETISSMRRAIGKITGNVSGEMRERVGVKPVMCDGEITVNEAVLSDNTVTLRGDAVIWCICFGADGLYYKTSSKAPFEEKIPLEGEAITGGNARGWGRCAAITVKDSDDGVLTWDMEYDLECEAVENVPVKTIRDMYSTMWYENTVPGVCDSLSCLKCSNGRLTVNGSSRRSGNITPADYIIGSYGKAVCDRIDRTGTRMTATGTADIRVPVCGGGEVTEECIRLPFRYEWDCGGDGDGELIWRCDVSVIDSSARLEGDQIQVTAELSLSVFAALMHPERYVAKLELDRSKKTKPTEGTVRIYYPAEGESPWDITKKYRIPKNAVTEITPDGVLIE